MVGEVDAAVVDADVAACVGVGVGAGRLVSGSGSGSGSGSDVVGATVVGGAGVGATVSPPSSKSAQLRKTSG